MQSATKAPAQRPLGVILAGGRATRMGGGDKSLRDLGGEPMLAHVIRRLRPQVGALGLNANGDPARFARFGLPVLADPMPGYLGPLAGILAGLDWASANGAQTIVTAAADTPFLPLDLAERLRMATRESHAPIALAATANGLHPTFGLWPVFLRHELRDALTAGERKVGAWALAMGATAAQFQDTPDPFFNINTIEDLASARVRLAEETP